MKIKELPESDRPREKALSKGMGALSESELIALILGSGKPGMNAVELGMSLINGYGGLSGLSRAPFPSLLEYSGLSKAKILRIMATFELSKRIALDDYLEENEEYTPDYLYEKYRPMVLEENQEQLFLLMSSRKKNFKKEQLIYRGTEKEMPFSNKDIISTLLTNYADRFVLVHNHPSGNPLPSPEDVDRSFRLAKDMQELGITMLDHVIVSKEGYYSFRESKLI